MAATIAFRFAPIVNPRSKLPRQPQCYQTRTLSPTAALQFLPPATHQPLPSLASLCRRGAPSVIAWADKNGAPEGDSVVSREQEYDQDRGQSSIPERFQHLMKEVPESPARWPWLIPLPFLLYAWRSVLWELSNLVHLTHYIGIHILEFVFRFIGGPVTGLTQCIGFSLIPIRSIYFSTVAYAPVRELSTILLLTSWILAIAEATSPDSVNHQQGLLIAAGLVCFGVVRGFLPEAIFWLFLVGFFSYSRFVKKRDDVAAALPSVAALTAIGEPWLRALSLSTYMAFSIFQYSKTLQSDKVDGRTVGNRGGAPIPLVLAAVAIGINLAAMWIRRRHLTWMIV